MKASAVALLLAALGTLGVAAADPANPSAPAPVAGTPPLRAIPPPPPPMPEEGIVCPADVRLCADGSAVSRDPDKHCAFRPCPAGRDSK